MKVPWTPNEASILTVHATKSQKKRVAHRNDNPHGSFRINEKLKVKKQRIVEDELKALETEKKKSDAIEEKARLALEYSKLVEQYELCDGGKLCQCGASECPMLSHRKCQDCGVIKAHTCKKRACVAARKARSGEELSNTPC